MVVVSPAKKPVAEKPIEPKIVPRYRGTNKLGHLAQQLQQQNQLLMASLGIDAPIINLSTINEYSDLENDRDSEHQHESADSKPFQPPRFKHKNRTLEEIVKSEKKMNKEKAAEKRRKKRGS